MRKLNYSDLYSWFLGSISACILVFPKLTPPLFVLFAIFLIVGIFKNKNSWNVTVIGLAFISLYMLYLFGILFSRELSDGMKYAEYKLSFLLIPVLFFIKPNFQVNHRIPVLSLVLSTLYLGIRGVIHSLECYKGPNWLEYCFTKSNISTIHHPTYTSLFLVCALVGAWSGYGQRWKFFTLQSVLAYTLFACTFYLLCLSLGAILFLGIALTGLLLYFLYKKLGKITSIILSFFCVVILFLGISILPSIKKDVLSSSGEFIHCFDNPKAFLLENQSNKNLSGNQQRLVVWVCTLELIAENPFGVGTGNLDYHLFNRFNKYGYQHFSEKGLNPHNQYLQTFLEIGFIGLLSLLSILFLSIRSAIKNKNSILLFITAFIAFNMLFESMFQQRSGVVFFTFWAMLLTTKFTTKNNSKLSVK
jgi:O-antigen ligase